MSKTMHQFLTTCPIAIQATFREMTFQPGELLLTQGDPADCVYLLLEGEAGVYHLTLNGIQVLESIYGTAELFGELEVLNARPIICHVRARTVCRVIRIEAASFIRWLQADPDFALFICRQLADKLYHASLASVTNIAYPLKYRVLYFLWTASQRGSSSIRKEDVIAGLGSNERSINRVVRELIDAGLIEADRGAIRIRSQSDIVHEMSRFE